MKILFSLAGLLLTTPALAHTWHVGELAGHSHWVAIGATIAAATLGAIIAKAAKPTSEHQTDDDPEDVDSAASEPAQP